MIIDIEFENIFKESLVNGINLFAGSGFSVLANDLDGSPLPISKQLKDELITEFSCPELKSLPLDKLSSILEANKRDDFNKYIKRRFSVASFNPLYNTLNECRYNYILTTNVDNLLPKIFADNNNFYLNYVTKTGPVYMGKSGVNYVPLHGSIEDESLVFSPTAIASAFSSDYDKWYYFTHALQEFPTIFWGYAMEDSGVLQSLYPPTIKGREKKVAWIMLKDDNHADIEYFRSLGLSIIHADTESMLNYILKLNIFPRKTQISFSTNKIFPEYSIPDPANVPSRPITQFYIGEPPIWSDIFSGSIYKTKYYYQIENEIFGGHNIIVTGLAASGKTTIMMQLAAGIKYGGHKLICQNITKEKSDFIIKQLKEDKALIFIDDFANDVDAFKNLLNRKNIQIVGLERDYNYEIISHKISEQNFKRIDITALDDKDIQGVFDKIPDNIRKIMLSRFENDDIPPSIFELIQLNTNYPKLEDRFKEVIHQLDSSRPILVNILVMLSYVHSCRTHVSFDMLLAFLRKETANYNEIHRLIEELGEMVKYASTAIVIDDNQDYFIPRSTLIAEAIMKQVPSHILKRVINIFHKEVSPIRIFNYNTFKRRAYDSDLIARAFPINEWSEGYKFYENVFDADNSEYLKQQGALYLARMQHYREAFIWIDQALVQTEYKRFSIKNSYAIILFKANIDKETSDTTVKATLDESMKILSECHKADKRKLYHALVFADQAIKYYNKFNDAESQNYLQTSQQWLSEELTKGFRIRDIQRLLRDVVRILQSIK